jgi:hypothetical protein
MEPRRLLSVLGPDGTLSVQGTDARNTISVSRVGGGVVTVVDGVSQTFAAAAVRRVVVDAGGATDAIVTDIDLGAGGAGIPIDLDGGALAAEFTFNGTGAADVIHFANAPGAGGTLLLNNSTLTFRGAASEVLNGGAGDDTFVGDGPALESMGAISGGAGADTILYFGTDGDDRLTFPSYFGVANGAERVVVDGRGGNDVFEASRVSQFMTLVLRGGDGDDQFRLLGMAEVGGGVALEGGAGNDGATYVDTRGGASFTLTGTRLSRSGYPAPSYPDITHADVEAVALATGSGAETIRLTPSETTAFTLNAPLPPTYPGQTDPWDTLVLDRAGLVDPLLTTTGPGAGVYTFGNRRPVQFSGVRVRPDFEPPRAEARYEPATRRLRLSYTEGGTIPLGGPGVEIRPLREDGSVGPAVPLVVTPIPGEPAVIPFAMGNQPAGRYRITVAPGSAVDADGDPSTEDFRFDFDAPAAVAGRHVWNNEDLRPRESDRLPLLPGQAASFMNVSPYHRGLNGIVVDVAGLPADRDPTPDDFELRVGAGGDPAAWEPLGLVPAIDVRRAQGDRIDGASSDRVTLTFPDDAIRNAWLQVRVKPTGATALPADDVFYFGSLPGKVFRFPETSTPLRVTAADLVAVTRAVQGLRYTMSVDTNGDFRLDQQDVTVVRRNLGGRLEPFTAPAVAPSPAGPVAGAAAAPALAPGFASRRRPFRPQAVAALVCV